SQCCPVTSYLQRCALRPVTCWNQVSYYEPVTTCCNTTTGAPVAAPPAGATVVPGVSETTQPAQPTMPPGVSEERQPAPAGSDSYKKLDNSPGTTPYMPPVRDGSFSRQPQLRPPVQTPVTAPVQTPPKVRLDRIASIAEPTVDGQVVSLERAIQPGVKLLFVSTDVQGQQQTVQSDEKGQIRANLPAGGWLVYLVEKDGKTDFQQRLEVRENETKLLTFVKKGNVRPSPSCKAGRRSHDGRPCLLSQRREAVVGKVQAAHAAQSEPRTQRRKRAGGMALTPLRCVRDSEARFRQTYFLSTR